MDELGEPLTTQQVGKLLGMSQWCVRQRLIPMGLPYFRIGKGRFVFYKSQVLAFMNNRTHANVPALKLASTTIRKNGVWSVITPARNSAGPRV